MPTNTTLKESTIGIQEESIPPPAYTSIDIQQQVDIQQQIEIREKRPLYEIFNISLSFKGLVYTFFFISFLIFPHSILFAVYYEKTKFAKLVIIATNIIVLLQVVLCIILMAILKYNEKLYVVFLVFTCINVTFVLFTVLFKICQFKI
jgi:hypothetical protein